MKKIKKILALLLCAVLLVGASVAGTLAYLTDSQDITNTFTVGNVHIKLDEAIWDKETGMATDSRTEDGNTEILLLPGMPIDKDPTVTVLKNSEDCYVRAVVTVTVPNWNDDSAKTAGLITDEETFGTWAKEFAGNYLLYDQYPGFNANAWNASIPYVDESAHTITYILTCKTIDGSNIIFKNTEIDTPLPALFNNVRVPTVLTNDQLALLAGMTIAVEAHAIQADGFDSAVDAWEAFEDQNP